jgi:CubicO group peptidase (beta-lactamase class C family)
VVNRTKTFNVPGIAVAIVKDGSSFGRRLWCKINCYKKGRCKHSFGIASNSKVYECCFFMLVDEGKIKMGRQSHQIPSNFRMYNDYIT